MPEWLIERGIGETRTALIDCGEIVEARIDLDGLLPAGTVIHARLVSAAHRNAVARDEAGGEYLLPGGAPGVSEGGRFTLEIARAAIPGQEPWKRPLGRLSTDSDRPSPSPDGRQLTVPAPRDELGDAGWNDLIEQARSTSVAFAGGELRISPTPAMTLIDVDGYLDPDELAVAGASHVAKAIRRLDIGGSIGIDLPTARGKEARQAAAAEIDRYVPQPFERTAVNGFGFVQIVRPRVRASLVELAQDRAAFEARALLRRAAFNAPGPKRLVLHPAVAAVIEAQPQWLDGLSRQLGGTVALRANPATPMSGGYAEPA